VKNIDCQDSQWVDAKEIITFDFAAADILIIKKFLNSLK